MAREHRRLGITAAGIAVVVVVCMLLALAGCSSGGDSDGGRITTKEIGYMGLRPVYELIDHATGRSYLLYSSFRTGAAMVEVDSPTDGPVVYDTPATREASDGTD